MSHTKHVAQPLVHKKYSLNVCCYCYHCVTALRLIGRCLEDNRVDPAVLSVLRKVLQMLLR